MSLQEVLIVWVTLLLKLQLIQGQGIYTAAYRYPNRTAAYRYLNRTAAVMHGIIILHADCPVLNNPADGTTIAVTGQTSGSTATYTCDSDLQLLDLTSGSNVRTCQTNGSWSLPEPQCVGKFIDRTHIN